MKKAAFILGLLVIISCNSSNNNKKADNASAESRQMALATKDESIADEVVFDFEDDTVGSIPEGWSHTFTGDWKVMDDNGNKVLKQISSNHSGSYFNVIVNDQINATDVDITVRFKGVAGREDQGGGPVWRYQNIDNYYIARANPLENNFRVYKVVNGRRKEMKSADLEIQSGKWYTLRITMQGDKITCYFDGKPELETTDKTFTKSGKTGLWTKADAVTVFDDMKIKVIK